MSCILVPFMKEIVGYLVFQTEILDGFTLWHCFRLVADEQPLMLDYSFALKSKLISFSLAYPNNSKSLLLYILLIFFVTAAKVIFFILWSNTSKLDAYVATGIKPFRRILITFCVVLFTIAFQATGISFLFENFPHHITMRLRIAVYAIPVTATHIIVKACRNIRVFQMPGKTRYGFVFAPSLFYNGNQITSTLFFISWCKPSTRSIEKSSP